MLGVTKRPPFGHGVEVPTDRGISIVCSYHPSQQNTFTGRLTRRCSTRAVRRAWELANRPDDGSVGARRADGPLASRLAARSAALHEPAQFGP